jgi:hypothetical protein
MSTGLTYASYQAAVVTQIPSLVTDSNFQVMLPNSIDYVETSIQRDLDFLSLHGDIELGNTTIGVNTQAVPSAVVVLEMLYYGPHDIPVTPASSDYIRTVFAGAANGPPLYFVTEGSAMASTGWTPGIQVLLGPAPDAAYVLSGYGTQRQTPMSAANPTTFIWQNLPDLAWAAAMIYWSGYTHNFGAMTDSPQMPMSWSAEYKRLLQSAQVEEARKKFQGQGWQAQAPTPIAGPRT